MMIIIIIIIIIIIERKAPSITTKDVVFFLSGDSPAPEFYVPTFWNTVPSS